MRQALTVVVILLSLTTVGLGIAYQVERDRAAFTKCECR